MLRNLKEVDKFTHGFFIISSSITVIVFQMVTYELSNYLRIDSLTFNYNAQLMNKDATNYAI